MSRASEWDPTAPLPEGTVLLEASAGTGKTHAIAALATRYLAEGVCDSAGLAVISFSHNASWELRSRVRDRIDQAVRLLEADHGSLPPGADETDRFLLEAPADRQRAYLERLREAARSADRSLITTIHQFCQAMLDELGVLAAVDRASVLVEDLTGLCDNIVDDLYLDRYAGNPAGAPFGVEEARAIGHGVLLSPHAHLVEPGGRADQIERVGFGKEVAAELCRRKAAASVHSFDDQLSRLRDVLDGPHAAACLERMRKRCRVVLVDEFQDTDPVQWEILHRAFHHHRPLVLIGDPKQSIYTFRGADTAAYSDAATTAQQRYGLSVNRRADPAVIEAVNKLFGGVELGAGITVAPTTSSRQGSRLLIGGEPAAAGVQLRVRDEQDTLPRSRKLIASDLVEQVLELLDTSTVRGDGATRALRPRDIAVLATTNRRGRELTAALTSAGVPAAFTGTDSVFTSPVATQWATLLAALDSLRPVEVRRAMITDFYGADLADLARASGGEMAGWTATLHQWGRLLASDGVAALFTAVQRQPGHDGHGLAERVLGRQGGDRAFADHRQLAQTLHERHLAGVRGPALRRWLVDQLTAAQEGNRRLETDGDAIQVMTVHRAKGLQFPVVMLPEAADRAPFKDRGQRLEFHQDGKRLLDLAGDSAPGRDQRWADHLAEQSADHLRALYVAMTRAESRLVLWWARTPNNTASSALHRLLQAPRDPLIPVRPAPSYPLDLAPGDTRPQDIGWLSSTGVDLVDIPSRPRRRRYRSSVAEPRLRALAWQRSIDPTWRRTSYSGLTAGVHEAALGTGLILDEPPPAEPASGATTVGTVSPMADLPGGAAFGSLVHQVLEHLDWHAPRQADLHGLRRRLLAATTSAVESFPLPGAEPQALAEALEPSLLTPLGSLADDRRLVDIAASDRLSELDFELSLPSSPGTTLADITSLLQNHLDPADPLAGYPAELSSSGLGDQPLHGFLTGSIDSVLRVVRDDIPRYLVIDYKTNRLGGEDLFLEHYQVEPMATEMIRAHYPLQALLYCVALHRFLRIRQIGYRPELHLGGVGYLFVRGMPGGGGPDTGVMRWFPPVALITEVSDLLEKGR